MKRTYNKLPSTPTSTPPTLRRTPRTLRSHNDKSNKTYHSKRLIFKSIKLSPEHDSLQWIPLNLPEAELSLPLTFPTGQTFRWKKTGSLQYTGVVGSHLVSLKHLQNGDVSYCLHNPSSQLEDARKALLDFLNVKISLTDIWEVFSNSDERFALLARHLGGVRVLRQDPFECLIQFLCSSNNNIQRITKMVDYVSSLGDYLGAVEGFDFYVFPSLERLSVITEQQLREAGFGYRAKYIVSTVEILQSKPGGGTEWLQSLRKLDLVEVIDHLCTLPGVGPKVAACIALFSLDQHHAIPVDTHVWQIITTSYNSMGKIATRYLLPELAGVRLTPKLHSRVADAFVTKYGKYAGWAQTLLFIAELPSQKALLPSHIWTTEEQKLADEKSEEAHFLLKKHHSFYS